MAAGQKAPTVPLPSPIVCLGFIWGVRWQNSDTKPLNNPCMLTEFKCGLKKYTCAKISQFKLYGFEEELWLSEGRAVRSGKGICKCLPWLHP